MDPELWKTLENLFLEASQLPPDEQSRFIEEHTEGRKELEAELRRLLKGHDQRSILDNEIGIVAAEALDELEILPADSFGPYKLLRKLGRGGMGVVYLAYREDWQIHVAIKVPRDTWISPGHRHRFLREQELLAKLIYPSIARIYEAGTLVSGTPWFAMEYVAGEPINSYCQRKSLPLRNRLQLFLAVCDATQYAHSQAIIHRDLKPSNILVTDEGKVKLLDFGIAKQVGEDAEYPTLTQAGLHPVTLAYAAPEQILRNEVSTQTDVYSLGVVLYEMLSGELPFKLSGLSVAQAGEVVQSREVGKPSTTATRMADVVSRQWADLDVLVLKAMHKDAGQRYRTVDALMTDIKHFLADEPLEARPDSALYRLKRFTRRNWKPLSFAAVASMLVVSLVVVYTVKLARARDAALQEAARTRLAKQFTRTLLEGGDANYGPSKDLRVIDMLDRGLKKAESLKADPLQQADLYTTLGSLFTSLGEYGKADSTLQSAYRILAKASPVSHEFSEVLMDLGILYSSQSQDDQSLTYFKKALNVEQQITPSDKKLLFRSKLGVAYALLMPDPRAAIVVLNELLQQPVGDTDENARSDVWNNLATAYINIGEFAKAEPLARKVLEYSQKTRPAIHPDISEELINLSNIQQNLRDYPAAEQNLRKALAIDVAWYPKGNEETGDVKRMLANVLLLEGRLDEAMPLAREALADEQKSLGNLNRRTCYAMHVVGILAFKRGELAEAKSMFEQEIASLQIRRDPSNLPHAFSYLGDVYRAQKLYKKSEEAYRRAAELYSSSLVPASGYRAQSNRKLGEVLMLEGQFVAAEAPLLAAYHIYMVKPESYADQLRLTRQDLVKVYEALERKPERERFQQQLSGMR